MNTFLLHHQDQKEWISLEAQQGLRLGARGSWDTRWCGHWWLRMNLHPLFGWTVHFCLSHLPHLVNFPVYFLSVIWRKAGWTTSLTKILFLSLLFLVIHFFHTCNISAPSSQLSPNTPPPELIFLCFLLISTITPSSNFVKLKRGLFSLHHPPYHN